MKVETREKEIKVEEKFFISSSGKEFNDEIHCLEDEKFFEINKSIKENNVIFIDKDEKMIEELNINNIESIDMILFNPKSKCINDDKERITILLNIIQNPILKETLSCQGSYYNFPNLYESNMFCYRYGYGWITFDEIFNISIKANKIFNLEDNI